MSPSRRVVVGTVFALIAWLAGAPLAAQDTTLRYRWTKGETQRYRTTAQTEMVMSGIPGMGDMTVTTTMAQVMKMVSDDVAADGTATLRMTYESIKMNMSIPMVGDVVYDSADPAASVGPIAESLKPIGALVGQPFTMVVSPAGKVTKIDGLGPIIDKARAGLEAAAGGASAMGGSDINSILNEASQKSQLEQIFMGLPDKPVKVGESWNNSYKIPNPFGAQAVSQVYTLKATGATTQIGLTGTLKPDGAPGAMGPMTVSIGEGKSSGDITFDTKLGRVRKMVTMLSMPLTMTMAGPDGSNMNLQANSKTTTTVELIEK